MQLVVCGVRRASTLRWPRTESWSCKDSTDRREAKVCRAHAAPQGVCDNFINALELLANQQKDGDCPVSQWYRACKKEVGSEQWTGLRRFINHELVI